jgi:hypothetical protein
MFPQSGTIVSLIDGQRAKRNSCAGRRAEVVRT